ncbi:hypothetical protein B0H11DRAFT_1915598 [Mycena galericulata]|nr:hypothetical protein B0H11DRAFT_1915598 [Mycena galericulata]
MPPWGKDSQLKTDPGSTRTRGTQDTLRVRALVARSFRRPCQKNLFSRVILRAVTVWPPPDELSRPFSKFLASRPHIGFYNTAGIVFSSILPGFPPEAGTTQSPITDSVELDSILSNSLGLEELLLARIHFTDALLRTEANTVSRPVELYSMRD